MNYSKINTTSLRGKAVNFHLTQTCNMSCKFCFAKYSSEKELSKLECFEVIEQLAKSGVSKINFAGGEPFLLPHLGSLIILAKQLGMTTGVITNGSRINTSWLNEFGSSLDWLGVSIDSLNLKSNYNSGRCRKNGTVQNFEQLESHLLQAKAMGISTKINTVVSRYNLHDDLTSLITTVQPDRWKIFQALPISGANENEDFLISDREYKSFLDRHAKVMDVTNSLPENNSLMTSSYIMISPQGKFYCNATGRHLYSDSILDIGIDSAFKQVIYDHKSFLDRGGIMV